MHTATSPSSAPDSLAARVERHLLYNVGVAPAARTCSPLCSTPIT